LKMLKKPTGTLMAVLQQFVFRHKIFLEAREFDDGLIFVREPKGRAKRFGPRRNFEVFLRRENRRVHVYTLTCGSAEEKQSQVSIDFPERALLRPTEAALEYEDCGRDMKRYSTRFPSDPDAGRALFRYVRSESRTLKQLLGDRLYWELLRLVRRHGLKRRTRPPNRRLQPMRAHRRPVAKRRAGQRLRGRSAGR